MPPTALVTGASGGIGREIAVQLSDGFAVVVNYHSDKAGAEDAVDTIVDRGGDALAHQCDVTDLEAVEEMVTMVTERYGHVNVLVNNAGIFPHTPLEDATEEQIRRTIQVNLVGAIYCVKAVLPTMIAGGYGRIVNVSSISGTHGSPSDPVYSASKAGLLGLTKSLSLQFAQDGILANAVAPGPTDTSMHDDADKPSVRERSPLGRLIHPEEIADAVRFFATTDSITGQVTVVDGGLT